MGVVARGRLKSFGAWWPSRVWVETIDAIRRDRIRYTVVRVQGGRPPVPTTNALRHLVRVALEASLAREEGREVVATLIFNPPTQVSEATFRFKSALSLDAETIRRLAPAVGAGLGLGVFQKPSGDLAIWGIAERRQDAVEVRAIQPGRVVAKFGLVNVAFFEGYRCQLVGCTLSDLLHALSRLATVTAEGYLLVPYLVHLGMEIRTRGHGGCVVLLPATAKSSAEGVRIDPPVVALKEQYETTMADFERSMRDSPHENEMYLLSVLPDVEALFEGSVPPKTARAVKAVGGLALVDGAVLFDQNLALLQFGAILKGGDKKKQSWIWDEWAPGQRWRRRRNANISELGGTRHRSAFRFVVKNRGAVALICSQDGAISMMAQPPRSRYPLIARGIERAVM